MALDDVPSQAAVGPQGPFEVDTVPSGQGAQGGGLESGGDDVGRPGLPVVLGHGQAAAVDSDRVTVADIGEHVRRADAQTGGALGGLDGLERAELLDDSGEQDRKVGKSIKKSGVTARV